MKRENIKFWALLIGGGLLSIIGLMILDWYVAIVICGLLWFWGQIIENK